MLKRKLREKINRDRQKKIDQEKLDLQLKERNNERKRRLARIKEYKAQRQKLLIEEHKKSFTPIHEPRDSWFLGSTTKKRSVLNDY